jgi:hypothetical protein
MSSSKSNTSTRKNKNYQLKILEDTPEWSSAASRSRADSVMPPPPKPKLTLKLRSMKSSPPNPSKPARKTPRKDVTAKSKIPPIGVEKSNKTPRLRLKIDQRIIWSQNTIDLCRKVTNLNTFILERRALLSEKTLAKHKKHHQKLKRGVLEYIHSHEMVRHFPKVKRLVEELQEL